MTRKKATPRERTLYHFTCVEHLESIQGDGLLRTTESNVSRAREHAGPDVVWLLDLPDLGGLDHGLFCGSFRGTTGDKSLVRVTVTARGVRWLDWPPASRMEPEWRAGLIRHAGGMAAARHWWVAERPIPASRWQAVDVRKSPNDPFTPV